MLSKRGLVAVTVLLSAALCDCIRHPHPSVRGLPPGGRLRGGWGGDLAKKMVELSNHAQREGFDIPAAVEKGKNMPMGRIRLDEIRLFDSPP
jgi:hypothetical protein